MHRILMITYAMDRGGIETFIMNIYRHIDRSKIQFDFLTHPYDQSITQEYESEICSLGGRLYKAPSFSQHPIQYKKYIHNFFSLHHEYTIVHCHNLDSAALVFMNEAKRHGCYIIAHSHNTKDHGNILKQRILHLIKVYIRRYPDLFFACSVEAGEFAFGKKILESNNYKTILNGIDVDKYKVDEYVHSLERKKLFPTLSGPIIGTVGRLAPQKNQIFLLYIFFEISKYDNKASLILIGKGDLLATLKRKAKELKIDDRVFFVGSVDNVPEYLKAFDVFCMPSLYEGMPLSAVEAQCAGLPTILTRTISGLTFCTDLAFTVSLDKTPNYWAKKIIAIYDSYKGKRTDRIEQVRKAGFDIRTVANQLVCLYNHIYIERN